MPNEGQALLVGLLGRPPREIAAWALEQGTGLEGMRAKEVESSELFKVAACLREAPLQQKQTLVSSVVRGFGELPASDRARAMRLAMQAQGVASSLGRIRDADRDDRLAREEQPRDAGAPLVENLLQVAQAARFEEMPPEELRDMAGTAQQEAWSVLAPTQLLNVMTELQPDERKQLSQVLVEARVVPEDQCAVLEETIRPGGYADRLASSLRLLRWLSEYRWLAATLPVVEFFAALVLGGSCAVGLVTWLCFDSLLSLGMVVAGFASVQILGPVYNRLAEDPLTAVKRVSMDQSLGSFRQLCESALPGLEYESYWPAGPIAVAATCLLVLCGSMWAVVGAIELPAGILVRCNCLLLLASLFFVGLRVVLLATMIRLVFYLMGEVNRYRSRNGMLDRHTKQDGDPEQAPFERVPASYGALER